MSHTLGLGQQPLSALLSIAADVDLPEEMISVSYTIDESQGPFEPSWDPPVFGHLIE